MIAASPQIIPYLPPLTEVGSLEANVGAIYTDVDLEVQVTGTGFDAVGTENIGEGAGGDSYFQCNFDGQYFSESTRAIVISAADLRCPLP